MFAWAMGPRTYLGLTVSGFPGSPSVLSNMAVSIEQHVDWVVDRLIEMRAGGFTTIEATETAQAGWTRHVADCSMLTLHRLAATWYTGANVPGKVRGMLPYAGGVGPYRGICNEVVSRGMLGFRLTGPDGAAQCNDGEIVRLQPDVRLVLETMVQMKLPPLESLGSQGARDLVRQLNAARPAGRPVGGVADGVLQGADGNPLAYRLYRPATPEPHPIVVYFHGGGWVLATSSPTIRSAATSAAAGHAGRQRQLPPRPGAPLPGRRRRRLCRRPLGRRPCGRTRRSARAGGGRRLERRRQPRRRGLPAGA